MEKKYITANEKNVGALVAYGKAADSKLYYESTYTTQVTQADAENAFSLGLLLIKDSTKLLKPITMDGNKVLTASMVAGDSGSTFTPVEWACVAPEA